MADPSTNSPSFDAAIRGLEACQKAARKMLAAMYSTQDMLDELMRTVADDDSADMIDAIWQENRKAILLAEKAGVKGDE